MEALHLVTLSLALILAFGISIACLPFVIRLSKLKGWYDVPDERKVHKLAIPRTGGLVLIPAVMAALLLASLTLGGNQIYGLLLGMLLLYGTGLVDDFKGMGAKKKLLMQLLAASVMAIGGWRVKHLPGIPFLEEIPLGLQYGLSLLLVVAVINAYNLIDGIDGLAAGLAILSGAVFAGLFIEEGDATGAFIALAMVGAFAGFLIFNFAPARVFMGDTGSMGLGFLLAALSIRFMNSGGENSGYFQAWQVVAILSTPLYDMLRVMVDRSLRHGKIFKAERNHAHHLLVNRGLSHRISMAMIIAANGSTIALALLRPDMDWFVALPALSLVFVLIISIFRNMVWYQARREALHLQQQLPSLKSDNPFFEKTHFPS